MEDISIDSFYSLESKQNRFKVPSKHLSLGKRGCPEKPSADWTAPSAYEKHVSIRSGTDHLCPLNTEGQRSQRPTQE